MSEKRYKRFYVSESENQLTIYDNEGLDDYYHLGNDERDVKGICKLLNEQQATIQFFKGEIDELKKDIDIYKYEEKKHSETARKLYEENEQLKKARDESDKFIAKKGLGAEFLNWCVAND